MKQPKKIDLYDYQKECVDLVLNKAGQGINRQLINCSVGLGKTVISAAIIKHWMNKHPDKKCLFIIHKDELVDQTLSKINDDVTIINDTPNIDISYTVEKAERKMDPDANFVIASIQTLWQENRLNNINPEEFCLFVIDETHHFVSPKNLETINRLIKRGDDYRNDILVLGLTATTKRADGKELAAIYQEISYSKDILWAIENNYLSEPRIISVMLKTPGRIRKGRNDFVQADLVQLNNDIRNSAIFEAWEKKAKNLRTLSFAIDVPHSKSMNELWRKKGYTSEHIDYTTDPKRRREIIKEFKKGNIQILHNNLILNEGFDDPGIECGLLCRPTSNESLLIQLLGRMLRKQKPIGEPEDVLILDCVDACTINSLKTVPSLIGLPSHTEVKDKKLMDMKRKLDALLNDDFDIDFDKLVSTDLLDKPHELKIEYVNVDIKDHTLPSDIKSKLQWSKNHREEFYIRGENDEVIIIKPNDLVGFNFMIANIKDFRNGTNYIRMRSGLDLQTSINRAEYYIEKYHPHVLNLYSKKAEWRDKKPTDKQIATLRKWSNTRQKWILKKYNFIGKDGKVIIPETRDKASKMISMVISELNKQGRKKS